MAGIEQDIGTFVSPHLIEKTLECGAVVQVFAGMNLVAAIDAGLLEGIEDRLPAPTQFDKGFFHQTRRALRPGVKIGPGQSTRKGGVRLEAQTLRRPGAQFDLLHCPGLALLRFAVQSQRREAIEQGVIGRMHGDQLTLQMRRKLGHLQAILCQHTGDFIGIGLALRALFEIENRRRRGRDLQSLVAETGRPLRHGLQLVERGRVAEELRQENTGAFERFHSSVSQFLLRLDLTAVSTKAMPRTPSAMPGTSDGAPVDISSAKSR